MKQSFLSRETLLRLLYFVGSVAFTAVGSAVFIRSGMGTDPFGMLMQGVAKVAGSSNGTAHISINAAFILVILLIDRKYIRIGTFAALFVTGPMIDLASKAVALFINSSQPYFFRVGCTLISCVVMGFGLSGLINASVGMGGNDLLAIILSDKLKIQFRWVRIFVDAAFMLTGYLLGGTIGLGTVVCVVLIGPIAQFFVPYTAKPLLHLLRRFGG